MHTPCATSFSSRAARVDPVASAVFSPSAAPLPMPAPTDAAVHPGPTIAQALWPPPSHRMPRPEAGLVAGIADLFDAEHGAHAADRVRTLLPSIVTQFFPPLGPDGVGISFYLADCVLLYALQSAKAQLLAPHLRAFVDDFCAALSVARKITRLVELGEDLESIIDQGVLRFLRQGRAVLCPGGANLGHDGHAVMMLLLPQADGDVLCAVFNRGEGLEPWHDRDGDKVRPWLASLPADALCGGAGAQALRPLLEMQQPNPGHSVAGWYAALDRLVEACGGTRWLSGNPRATELVVPGQSLQKGNTCTVASTLAAMLFMMQVQLRCWQAPPSNTPRQALQMYREIKHACREVLLREAVAERGRAMAAGDVPAARALTQTLCDIGAAMLQRLPRKPRLRPCYEALPSDIRLLAEATSSSAV